MKKQKLIKAFGTGLLIATLGMGVMGCTDTVGLGSRTDNSQGEVVKHPNCGTPDHIQYYPPLNDPENPELDPEY